MQTQTRSTSSTILLILIILLTAPVWLTIGGVMLGVVGGVLGGIFGAVFGVFGALIGAFFGLITLPFKFLSGSCDVFDGGWFLSGRNLFLICLLILVVAIFRKK